MRKKYLKEHRRVFYYQLLTSGELADHLETIDRGADEIPELLVKQMAQAQDVTEKLKAEDIMKWAGIMNNIRNAAQEIVLTEVVYAN